MVYSIKKIGMALFTGLVINMARAQMFDPNMMFGLPPFPSSFTFPAYGGPFVGMAMLSMNAGIAPFRNVSQQPRGEPSLLQGSDERREEKHQHVISLGISGRNHDVEDDDECDDEGDPSFRNMEEIKRHLQKMDKMEFIEQFREDFEKLLDKSSQQIASDEHWTGAWGVWLQEQRSDILAITKYLLRDNLQHLLDHNQELSDDEVEQKLDHYIQLQHIKDSDRERVETLVIDLYARTSGIIKQAMNGDDAGQGQEEDDADVEEEN